MKIIIITNYLSEGIGGPYPIRLLNHVVMYLLIQVFYLLTNIY